MRSIPAELKARIEKAQQTLYENANPRMGIFVYNSRWNELFTVYTIHNKPNIDRIDVTAKREMASSDPNKLYAIYIEDGVSYVISKPLPYNELIPWTPEFTVGAASDVAIELNGYWERDQVSKRFNFIAEDKPWVFKQSAGSLTAQYWNETPIELATGVDRICTMRGWLPAQADHTQDQGLIVVYLKSGSAYYRNYCLQSDGTTYLWETEQQITALPTGLVDIALFRTNDFRVGVLGRDSAGNVHMTVTIRNWAGMSLYPEHISIGLTNYTVQVQPIIYHDAFVSENISAGIDNLFICAAEPIYPAIIDIWNDDEYTIIIKCNHLFTQDLEGLENAFTLTDENSTDFEVFTTAEGVDKTEIILTVANLSSSQGDITIDYDNGVTASNLVARLTCHNQGTEFVLENFSIPFTPDIAPPEGYVDHNLSVGLVDYTVVPKLVTYHDTYQSHNVSAGITNYTIVVTNVGGSPI